MIQFVIQCNLGNKCEEVFECMKCFGGVYDLFKCIRCLYVQGVQVNV